MVSPPPGAPRDHEWQSCNVAAENYTESTSIVKRSISQFKFANRPMVSHLVTADNHRDDHRTLIAMLTRHDTSPAEVPKNFRVK